MYTPRLPLPPVDGLTLRDYFAAAALQGLLAAPDTADWDPHEFVESSYGYADSMLAARATSHTPETTP